MTILAPMRPEAYDAYLEQAIAGYAHDNVAAGRWPQASALERSRADFAQSLPQGLATPDNYLFEIKTDKTGPVVGVIWFAVTEQNGMPVAFVYDVEIKPEWQRQGHAMRAFKALEPLVKELGLSRIGLHVFANNPGAQALYARLGYDVVSLNMAKQLGETATPQSSKLV